MPTAEWTPRAEAHLEDITFFIAVEDGRPAVAAKLAREIHEKVELYARQPMMGTARPDLGKSIRLFSYKRYVVLYVPIDDGIQVRAVVDGARDYGVLFED